MLTPNQVFDLKADSWRELLSRSSNLQKKFVVLGAGKTAMDTVVFLQRNLRVAPSNITWVIPNDVWMLRRNGKGSPWSWGEALVEKNLDCNEAALYLEAQGIFTRLDKNVVPTRFRFPVVGEDELSYMQKITNIVRRGRVTAISATNDNDQVEIQFGTNESLVLGAENHTFVHCSSPGPFNGGQNNTPFPSDDEIRLTFLYAPPVPISMSCLAALESRRRKGELDLEVGQYILGLEKEEKVNVSANDVLRFCIPGYSLSSNDGLSSIAASQHIEPLKNLAGFLALYDKDPKEGYSWMQQNRLSFFSIPGFKGKVYENLCQVLEKKRELGLDDKDVSLFSGLAEKLKPLEGM